MPNKDAIYKDMINIFISEEETTNLDLYCFKQNDFKELVLNQFEDIVNTAFTEIEISKIIKDSLLIYKNNFKKPIDISF